MKHRIERPPVDFTKPRRAALGEPGKPPPAIERNDQRVPPVTPVPAWKLVGRVSVDAGLLWIGDPCYILHKDGMPHDVGESWPEFCERIEKASAKTGVAQFKFDMGHAGLGVCVGGFGGDGLYPVYARYDSRGLIVEVRVCFDGRKLKDGGE